jgi:hypothetical protein
MNRVDVSITPEVASTVTNLTMITISDALLTGFASTSRLDSQVEGIPAT